MLLPLLPAQFAPLAGRGVVDGFEKSITSDKTLAGHALQLDHLGAEPLMDLDLRLGEGTGCALALPLLGAACAFLREMATFESAQVSEKSE